MRSDDRIVDRLRRLFGREDAQPRTPVSHKIKTNALPVMTKEEKTVLRDLYLNGNATYSQDTESGSASVLPIRRGGVRIYFSLTLLSALGLSLFYLFARSPHFGSCGSGITLAHGSSDEVCPQTTAVAPEKHRALLDALEGQYQTEGFKVKAYESLGGAIRVPYVLRDAS